MSTKGLGNSILALVKSNRVRNRLETEFKKLFYLPNNSLEGLREQWGKPLKVYRGRKDISLLFGLTSSSDPKDSVDNDTWKDLDMDDLFDRIDSNITPIGRQYLYRQLRTYEKDKSILRQNYQNALIFHSNSHLREQTQLRLIALKASSGSYVVNMLFGELPSGNFSKAAVYLLVATTLVTFITALINPSIIWLPLVPMMVNFVFSEKHADDIGRHAISFGYLKKLLHVASILPKVSSDTEIAQIEYLRTTSQYIKQRQAEYRFAGLDSTSGNLLIAQLAFFMNLVCLLDFLIYISATKHLRRHRAQLVDIYNAVASIDSAISVASYISTANNLCNPQFCPTKEIQLDEVVHPLLDGAIANDYRRTASSALITGSNMAGKSTFIKTVGINLILAQTLWICHARLARLPCLPVLSSIKHTDSINEGKSYYFAEIESLLRMMELAKTDSGHVFLIDEILHGTNTVERVASAAAILNFLSINNTVFVTSHDVELTNLLCENFESFYFEESGDLNNMFDYKIKDGHCKSRNAISLLAAIGFPASVIEAANNNVSQLEDK